MADYTKHSVWAMKIRPPLLNTQKIFFFQFLHNFFLLFPKFLAFFLIFHELFFLCFFLQFFSIFARFYGFKFKRFFVVDFFHLSFLSIFTIFFLHFPAIFCMFFFLDFQPFLSSVVFVISSQLWSIFRHYIIIFTHFFVVGYFVILFLSFFTDLCQFFLNCFW